MGFTRIPNFGDQYAKINERIHSSGAPVVEVLYGARDSNGRPTYPENRRRDGHGHWVALEIDGLYQIIYWRHPRCEGGGLEYGSDSHDNPLCDLEADISEKEQLCWKAQNLSNSTDWKEALKEYDKIISEWKKIFNWNTPKEKELWNQLQYAKKLIYQKRDSARENNKTVKRRIISEAQDISLSNDWKQAGARFKKLFEEWRRVGSAGKNEDDILWKEFNSARQEFYKRRSKYYSELDEQHANNKQKKQTLISEARSIAQFSTEWKSSGERLNELMDKWKKVGSAGKDDDSLWKEFNSARQTFYDRRRIYYAEQDRQFHNNADRKSRIVQEASAISSSCDYSSQSTERMKRLSQEWKEVGFAGKENEDRLWSLFRNANDSFWSGKRSYNEQRHQEWCRKQNDAINRKRMQISNLQQQITDLRYKMIGMRNQEYINNMCRWIDEKEAKIRELEIVIRDIESKL